MKANIRDLWKEGKTVCVTTNGYVRKDGKGVMGRGNAKAMTEVIPDLSYRLGLHIRTRGNIVGFIYQRVIAFPVKPMVTSNKEDVLDRVRYIYKDANVIPGFHCKASLVIMLNSALQLTNLIEKQNINKVYLPVPGIGYGEIDTSTKLYQDIFNYLHSNERIELVIL